MATRLRAPRKASAVPETPGATMMDYLALPGSENDAAARALAPYLEKHGLDVIRRNGENVSVRRGNSKFVLSPKMSSEGLDRIVVGKFYGVEDRFRHSEKVDRLVKSLNEDLNVGTFSIDGDGDLLFQSHITFVERVEYAEIEAFLDFMDQSMVMAGLTHPEVVLYLQ